jgi:hypothetical protein
MYPTLLPNSASEVDGVVVFMFTALVEAEAFDICIARGEKG